MVKDQAWISPWWQAALLPPVWRVCGVTVLPLSSWHTFALEQLGNPYMCGGRCERSAAVTLLLFASTDYRGGRRLLLDPKHQAWRTWLMQRKVRKIGDYQLYSECADYVRSFCYTPRRLKESPVEGDQQSGCPYQWHIVHRLCASYRMDIETAWNAPFALGRCWYDVAAEAAGDDAIMNPDRQRMDDEMTAAADTEAVTA
jgi:hypothetical protein